MKLQPFFLLLLLVSVHLEGQMKKIEHEYEAGVLFDDPIKIEVYKTEGKYSFFARNKTYFPLVIRLEVTETVNLEPAVYERDFRIGSGLTFLVALQVKNQMIEATYSATYSARLSVTPTDYNTEYPFLLPVKNFSLEGKDGTGISTPDAFGVASGDTVFAMRKGVVLTTPEANKDLGRLSTGKSLEILHPDGSFTVYEQIKTGPFGISPGSTVYPGQPIGSANGLKPLQVYFLSVEESGELKSHSINYAVAEGKKVLFTDLNEDRKVLFPEEIITREMTKSELKKYRNDELF